MDIFASALARIFSEPNMASPAVWFPGGTGLAQNIRAVVRAPDFVSDYGAARILSDQVIVDVLASEVVTPAAGDRLDIDGVAYTVQAEPVRDARRLIWTLELVPL